LARDERVATRVLRCDRVDTPGRVLLHVRTAPRNRCISEPSSARRRGAGTETAGGVSNDKRRVRSPPGGVESFGKTGTTGVPIVRRRVLFLFGVRVLLQHSTERTTQLELLSQDRPSPPGRRLGNEAAGVPVPPVRQDGERVPGGQARKRREPALRLHVQDLRRRPPVVLLQDEPPITGQAWAMSSHGQGSPSSQRRRTFWGSHLQHEFPGWWRWRWQRRRAWQARSRCSSAPHVSQLRQDDAGVQRGQGRVCGRRPELPIQVRPVRDRSSSVPLRRRQGERFPFSALLTLGLDDEAINVKSCRTIQQTNIVSRTSQLLLKFEKRLAASVLRSRAPRLICVASRGSLGVKVQAISTRTLVGEEEGAS
jgi:hypothetical protein